MDSLKDDIGNGYEIRILDNDSFDPLFKIHRPKIFDKHFSLDLQSLFSQNERDDVERLRGNLKSTYRLNLGLYFKGEFIGWSWGRQLDHTRFYMVNSAVYPEHRGRGLYKLLVAKVIELVVKEGFQLIESHHIATNSGVIVPKLKAGFVISGVEVSDVFGLLVRLSYFANPVRRRMMSVRCGDLIPDEELMKFLPKA